MFGWVICFMRLHLRTFLNRLCVGGLTMIAVELHREMLIGNGGLDATIKPNLFCCCTTVDN